MFLGYFKWSQDKIEKQAESIALQDVAIKTLTKTVETIQADIKKQIEKTVELVEKQKAITTKSKELSKILSEHNLERIASRKPKMLDKIINKGTKNVFDTIEDITK